MTEHTVVVPLLSSYKHSLLRRRLFQVVLGGARVRRVPWYIHFVQGLLWILPLAFAVPFIIVDAHRLWNPYFLALVYACIVGVCVLVEGLVVVLLRWQWRHRVGETPQYDDELDEVEIPSCFGLETVDFVFSRKRLSSVLLHPLVSGLLSFCSLFTLLPTVMKESLPTAGVVVVSLLGWFAFGVAHYSLAVRAPPETAVYRPVDPLELKFVNRPTHLLLICIVIIVLRLSVSEAVPYHQLLYAFICLLPLGWVLGALPPLDAFCPWLMEQVLTRLLGGSPMATDLRLLVMLTLSIASVGVVVPASDIASFLLLTVFGFLLSQDVFKHTKAVLSLLSSRQHHRVARCTDSLCQSVFRKTFVSYGGGVGEVRAMSDLRVYLWSVLFSAVKESVLLAISLVCIYFTATVESAERRLLLTRVFSSVVIVLCAFVFVSDCLQRPYVLGVVRNCLFPKLMGDVAIFKAKKRRLQYASIPRRLILAAVGPLVMFALVGVRLSDNDNMTGALLWQRIATARVLRAIWQNTASSLSELALVSVLILALPADNAWISLGLPTQALLVGLLLHVAGDFLPKASFILMSLITFVWVRKHRTHLALGVVIVAGSMLFLPLLVGVVLVSSVLSAPLLPLFTLPVFTSSFPRPQRFWPSLVDYGSTYLKSTEETIYYQQAEPELARAVSGSLSRGAVPSRPGTQLLLRFDNRLALVSVLEAGRGFRSVNIRGLELQETSCHSEEATRIDAVVECVHRPASRPQRLLNTHLLDTLTPADSVVVRTYSDARNVLTGIIDQPANLQQFSANLMRTLVWVFFGYIKATVTTVSSSSPLVGRGGSSRGCEKILSDPTPFEINDEFDTAISPTYQRSKHFSMVAWKENRSKSLLSTFIGDASQSWTSLVSADTSPVRGAGSVTPPPFKRAESISPPPFKRAGSVTPPHTSRDWTDSPQSLIPKDLPLERKGSEAGSPILPPLPGRVSGMGLRRITSKVSPKHEEEEEEEVGVSPLEWAQPPLAPIYIFRLMQSFPHDWATYLNQGTAVDVEILELLSKTVVGCFSLLDVPANAQGSTNKLPLTYPLDIYKRFCGNVPHSSHLGWMKDQPTIWRLALKAYRYAVKLMYDEGCLGEAENWEELAAYMSEYDQKWCIVRETEVAWAEAILANTPHIFSLGHDRQKDVYTAHVLSLQDEVVHVGMLNPAALGGIWADLALELLFLTNDDEERYSIQAHPHLLRNLSIQTAEPPLGYTVHSSAIMSIPAT